MKQKTLSAMIVILALSLSGGALHAQDDDKESFDRGGPRGMHRGAMHGMDFAGFPLDRIADKLGLEDEQQQSIRNVLEAARPEFESLRERSRENREAIRSLDTDDPGYGAELQNLSAQSGELAAELVLLSGRVRGDVNALLTPEQRQQIAEFREGRGDRRGRGRRGSIR